MISMINRLGIEVQGTKMKLEWKDCLKVGCTVLVIFLCIYYWSFLTKYLSQALSAATPLLIGCVIAYIVDILMSFYDRFYFPRRQNPRIEKTRTPACMLLAFVSLVLIFMLLLNLVLPELSACLKLILAEVPKYLNQLTNRLLEMDFMTQDMSEFIKSLDWKTLVSKIAAPLKSGLDSTLNLAVGVFSTVASLLVNLVIGLIFSIYLLLSKKTLCRQCRRLITHYIPQRWNKKIFYVLGVLNDCFHKYIVGQCLEAVILGILCTVGMVIFQFPYAQIVGAVVGFSALVPIAGAYIGGAVGCLLIVMVSPMKALLFLVYLVILQQLEGNIIYPRVVGSSLGLPGIWVLAAVTVGGGVCGVAGMMLGVPIAAALYRIIKNDLNKRKESIETEA